MANKALQYLTTLHRFEEIKPGLQTMQALLAALGNPQTKFRSVHIAGTNGKGSTAAFLASILRAANYKTGLYTSPHLCSFNERVVINGRSLDDQSLSRLINRIRQAAQSAHLSPTFFEFTTALAFQHFAKQQIDIGVIEVGMGGDLDATNVITPLVSIITNVSVDHTEWLGPTAAAIAKHKAGIIKPSVPLVTAETNPAITSILARRCSDQNAPFYHLSNLLQTNPISSSLACQSFSTQGLVNNKFKISLLGPHQLTNAATAITTALVLRSSHPAITTAAIKRGLSSARWAGRLDIVSRRPFILLDGAHNDAGLDSLASALDNCPFPPADTLVVGIKSDTNPAPIIKTIAPRFRQIITTQANYDPFPVSRLQSLFNPKKYALQAIPDPQQAITYAIKNLKPGSLLLVTGSLYLIGDILSALKKPPYHSDGQRPITRRTRTS